MSKREAEEIDDVDEMLAPAERRVLDGDQDIVYDDDAADEDSHALDGEDSAMAAAPPLEDGTPARKRSSKAEASDDLDEEAHQRIAQLTEGRGSTRKKLRTGSGKAEQQDGSDDDQSLSAPAPSSKKRARATASAAASASASARPVALEAREIDADDFEAKDDGEIKDEEEDEDTKAADILNAHRLLAAQNQEARAGILDEILLQNFLCHANLRVKLGPNINFIHGNNGSGKSSILIALQMAFGARTHESGRGSRNTSLIRTGATWARIEVTLKNEGPEAWKVKEYGKRIVVRRDFSRTGTSSYKILDAKKEKTVSIQKKELDNILEHFGIQPTNPCAIMNQDISREFLQSSKKQDKYAFFLKATQLEGLKQAISNSRRTKEKMRQNLLLERDALERDEKRYRELEAEQKAASQLRLLQKAIADLTERRTWAQVEALEAQLEDSMKNYQTHEVRAAALRQRLAELDEQNGASLVAAAKQKYAECQERVRQSLSEAKMVADRSKEAQREIQRAVAEAERLEKRIKDAQRTKQQADRYLLSLQDQKKRDVAAEQKQIMDELHEKEERCKQLKADVERLQVSQDKQIKEREETEEALKEAKKQLSYTREEERGLQETIDRAKRIKQNSLAVFGGPTPSVLEKIARGRFSRPPVGPIGRFIQVRDPSWAKGVETVITPPVINMYICANHHDAETLRRIIDSENYERERPQILIQKVEPRYRVRNLDFRHSQPTVYDLFNIEDDWVHNAVIDQTSPESYLAEDSTSVAYDLAHQYGDRGLKGLVGRDGAVTKGKGGSVLLTPGDRNPHAKFLAVQARQEDVEDAKQKLQHSKAKVADADKHATEYQKMLAAFTRNITDSGRKLTQLKAKVASTEKEIIETQEQLKREQPEEEDNTADIEEAKRAIAEAQAEVDDLTAQRQGFKQTIDQRKQAYQAIEAERASHSSQAEQLSKETDLAMKTVEEEMEKMNRRAEHYNSYKTKLDATLATQEENKAKLADLEAQIKNRIDFATEQGLSRVPTGGLSVKALTNEIIKVEAQYDAQLKRLGGETADQINARFAEFTVRYEEKKVRHEKMKATFQELEDAIEARVIEWRHFRKNIKKTCDHLFNFYLSQQNFAGKIEFDDKQGELDLQVTVNESSATGSRTATDTKSLSGGERAFSTLAFVLSLGDAIQSPIRAMDEFDIFMDSVNRRTSIRLLIETASKFKNRQFIFITPNDVSMVTPNEFIKLHRLEDPERRDEAQPA